MYEDNTACIEWGNHVIGGRERAKHIDIRKHFAHEVIQNQEMLLIKKDTTRQLADIFTKPLLYPQFLECLHGVLLIRSRVNLGLRRGVQERVPGRCFIASPRPEPYRAFEGVFAGKELWKGPSRPRARGTRRACLVAGARLGRMGHARSPNGIIG